MTAVGLGRIDKPFGIGAVIAPLATAGAFLLLPGLFLATRERRMDRLLGELSYPVYISHVLVIWLVGHGSLRLGTGDFFIALGLVLLTAIALYQLVDRPIDRLRHARLRAATAPVPV